jgi:DNA (cytosine-5)-methyltransferase 1
MCGHGYYDDWKELNSADFGAHTSRNRLFGLFARYDLPVAWPIPTHAKNPIKHNNKLEKWKPVKEVLDFDDKGDSIFAVKYNKSKKRYEPRIKSAKTFERIYAGLLKYVAKGDSKDFLLKYNSTNGKTGVHVPPSINNPSPALNTHGRLGIVQTQFLCAYYGTGDNISSIDSPCPVVPTKDRFQFVQPEYFINNPSHGGHNTSVDMPCPVIVARQDKAPLRLIEVETGVSDIPVYDDDWEVVVKIKYFMAEYNIADIRMRMLKIPELLKIQGFPDGYKLAGNSTHQKKFIGNSVVPHVVTSWTYALLSQFNRETKVA